MEPEDPARLTATLAAMAAAVGIAAFPPAAVAVLLPILHQELNTSVAELQWAVTAYTLSMAASLLAAGRLGDAFGRRRVLICGAAVLTVGAAVAAAAPSAPWVIVGLAIAGIGGAAQIPTSLAILIDSYPAARRGLPIGVWGAASALGEGVAPLVSGALAGGLGWRWVFLICVVVSLLVIATVYRFTPESRDEYDERSIDSIGVGLWAAALLALSLALIQAPTWGWGSAQTAILFAVSALLTVGIVAVERRAAVPLVDLGLLRHRGFAAGSLVLFAINVTWIAALFVLPLSFQELLGYTVAETGLLILAITGAAVVFLPLGGRVAERIGPLPPITAGVGLMVLGVILLSELDLSAGAADVPPLFVFGAGFGLALTPVNVVAMNTVPASRSGAAGGLFTTLGAVGMTLGVAVSGALFASLQTSRTVSLAREGGVALSRDAAADLDGLLAGSSDAAHSLTSLSPKDQPVVVDAVREAFAFGVNGALRLAAAVALAGLVVAWVLFPRRSLAAQPAGDPHG